jgi:twinfilin-like protein
MARANLAVDQELSDAFFRAQESGAGTRILKVVIDSAAEKLVLSSTGARMGTAEEDFANVLVPSVDDTSAALLLFCLSDDRSRAQEWLFLSWVPDGARVRDKMLYSSSKEDLKRSLGQGYFTSEYSANLRTDLTWSGFNESIKKTRTDDLLSERERSVFEERLASRAESNTSKLSAMNVLPFQATPELRAKLAEFKSKAINWVDMTVTSETVNLVSAKHVGELSAGSSLQEHASDAEARFIVTRQVATCGSTSELTFFIFSCPESVPVRSKMVMSSAKATVLAIASEIGLSIDRNLEIRATADLDDAIRSEVEPTGGSAGTGSSSSATLAHAKPTRPGKGRSSKPVSKFVSDDD